MSVLSAASMQSAYRGYEYFKENKVLHAEQSADRMLTGTVRGSESKIYHVAVDIAHPRRSRCDCPHANGKQIVCKHKVAVYFAVFPQEAEQYITDWETGCEEERAIEREYEDQVIRYVHKMKKAELQQTLLQLLFEGPDWQYDRFIDEHIGH